MGLGAFDILGVDAVVADFRIGHRDDLAAIAGIGEDLLVAGHRGVEADFAVDFALGAEGNAGKNVPSSRASLAGWVMSSGAGFDPARIVGLMS